MFMKPLGSREECLGTTLFDAYHGLFNRFTSCKWGTFSWVNLKINLSYNLT